MQKTSTTYKLTDDIRLTVNEEYPESASLHEHGEPCSGILKHWGNVRQLAQELQHIIKKLEEFRDENIV